MVAVDVFVLDDLFVVEFVFVVVQLVDDLVFASLVVFVLRFVLFATVVVHFVSGFVTSCRLCDEECIGIYYFIFKVLKP